MSQTLPNPSLTSAWTLVCDLTNLQTCSIRVSARLVPRLISSTRSPSWTEVSPGPSQQMSSQLRMSQPTENKKLDRLIKKTLGKKDVSVAFDFISLDEVVSLM